MLSMVGMAVSNRLLQSRVICYAPLVQLRSYTVAIARNVPRTFANALSSISNYSPSEISYDRAASQHEEYISALRLSVPTLVLPASESHPDCVFVEDAAIAIGNRAVVNRIGTDSRRGEEGPIKKALKRFGATVTDMREEEDGSATCDGGDALYPVGFRWAAGERHGSTGMRSALCKRGGRHLFVGLSNRTNMGGIEVLKRVFEDVDGGVEVVPVPDVDGTGALHLKSIVTHVDDRTLLVPTGALGDEVLRAMQARERGYDIVRLPDEAACNVVSVNGAVFAPPTNCDETRKIFEKEMNKRRLLVRYIHSSEFAKCDGALTCMSILLDL